jgi:hypothetical protein
MWITSIKYTLPEGTTFEDYGDIIRKILDQAILLGQDLSDGRAVGTDSPMYIDTWRSEGLIIRSWHREETAQAFVDYVSSVCDFAETNVFEEPSVS